MICDYEYHDKLIRSMDIISSYIVQSIHDDCVLMMDKMFVILSDNRGYMESYPGDSCVYLEIKLSDQKTVSHDQPPSYNIEIYVRTSVMYRGDTIFVIYSSDSNSYNVQNHSDIRDFPEIMAKVCSCFDEIRAKVQEFCFEAKSRRQSVDSIIDDLRYMYE